MTDEKAAQKIFNQAEQLKQQGKIAEAISCYRLAIELDPNCDDYYYKLGNIFQKLGQLIQASIYYHQAIEINNNHSWSYHALGEILTQQKQIDKAIFYYRKAIEKNPDFSWSYYNLGKILQAKNYLEDAQDCFEKAIYLSPQYSWSYHFLAEVLTAQNKLAEAVKYYQMAIKINPNYFGSYYQLGKVWQQQEQLAEAVKYYQIAIHKDPQYFWSYYYLADALTKLEKFTEVIKVYTQAMELKPEYLPTYFALGKILIYQGQEVIEQYRQSRENQSDLSRAYLEIGLGQAWEQQSQFTETIKCYQNAITINPNLKLPYKLLQYVQTQPENIDRLITFYQKLTKIVPESFLAWGNLGDVLTLKNRVDEAVNCYRHSCYYNAIASDPKLAEFDWQNQKERSPDFIIIGESKCGTSSLFEYLGKHPQILLPHKKEINFFNRNFEQGINWYLAHFPSITDSAEFLTGEATTHYFSNTAVDRRMYQLFPDTKLIVMLRNPVDRTISDYYHHLNRGVEQRSLEEIIKSTKNYLAQTTEAELRYTDNELEYVLKSIYVYKICRWMTVFPKKNLLILESESFFANTASSMHNVFQFLGLPNYQEHKYSKYNIGNYP